MDNDNSEEEIVTEDNAKDTAVDETETKVKSRKPWGKVAGASAAAALALVAVFGTGYGTGLLQTHHLSTSACWSATDDSDACAVEQRAGIDRRAKAAERFVIEDSPIGSIAEEFEQQAERLKVAAVAGGWTQQQTQDEHDRIVAGTDTDGDSDCIP